MVLPYPYHKDDHQRTNAEPLEKSGAVIIAKDHKQLELNLHNVGAQLITLLSNHQMRFSMREKMLHAPMKNGANSIANACLR
jgi:UDP-N-acetylglucosamine:LPS N-acetylglucosamine transferase